MNFTATTYEIPAYAADTLGETLDLHCAIEWLSRIDNVAEHACYGPNYRRGVVENLRDMSRMAGWNDWDAAAHFLHRAEACAELF